MNRREFIVGLTALSLAPAIPVNPYHNPGGGNSMAILMELLPLGPVSMSDKILYMDAQERTIRKGMKNLYRKMEAQADPFITGYTASTNFRENDMKVFA